MTACFLDFPQCGTSNGILLPKSFPDCLHFQLGKSNEERRTSLLCTEEGGVVEKFSCTTSVAVRNGEEDAYEQPVQASTAVGDLTRSQN